MYLVWFWPDIHMTPEEGLRAHRDLQRGDASHGALLPIHWATFNLAPHPWAEPGERTLYAGHRAGARVLTPIPGEPQEPAAAPAAYPWWRATAVPPVHGWPAWPPVASAGRQLVAEQ